MQGKLLAKANTEEGDVSFNPLAEARGNSEDKGNSIKLQVVDELPLVLPLALASGKIYDNCIGFSQTEETGQQLLKRIKAEKQKLIDEKKIKKDKELAPIKLEEIPFKIPNNWVWCRMGEVALYSEAGKSYQAKEVSAKEGQVGVIKTSSITAGLFIEDENKLLPNQNLDFEKIIINKGDILFCRASGSKGLAGKSCLVYNDTKATLILSDKSIRFVFPMYLPKQFIQYYNSSFFAEEYYLKLGLGKSTSMNNITREQFKLLLIPLPPLSEQNRIVKKLEILMKYCDELEKSIGESKEQNERLLQGVLRDALSEK